MHFLEKIKPHITSNDFLIQETVLHSIHDYPCIPEDWTVQLLKKAFHDDESQSSILIYMDHQPLNDEALKVLIDNIPSMDQSNRDLALNLFDNITPELAFKYKDSLAKYIPTDTWTTFELMVNGTKDEVLDEYEKTLDTLEHSYEYELLTKAKKLAATIVQNGWITEDELEDNLKEEIDEEWLSFRGILTVYMIGVLKIEKYIPILASLLNRDDDILLEEVSVALIGFQLDEVVRAVKPYLKNSDSIIYSASIVENIKSDLAVQVLREAYRGAKELEDQDVLIEALSDAHPSINGGGSNPKPS